FFCLQSFLMIYPLWFSFSPFGFLSLISCHGSEIIDGKEVTPHSMPFMALLEADKGYCGGTLIDPLWVLTAAHCGNVKTVSLGVHSRKAQEKEKRYRQVCEREKNVPHPDFNSHTYDHDLMLVKLNEAVKQTQWVGSLKLNEVVKDPPAGSVCTVAGWGQTNMHTFSDVLMAVNVTVVNRTTCNSKDYYNSSNYVTENMICAGSDGKNKADACVGDSGGPILCNGALVGVTSFGAGNECGKKDRPGVYAFLTRDHLEWIKKTMKT
uniref:Granzyme A-like n=1 Tax=Fundulus heteroclitus TaxID=8078 RepID=A0A3Q2U2D2_FUNHE